MTRAILSVRNPPARHPAARSIPLSDIWIAEAARRGIPLAALIAYFKAEGQLLAEAVDEDEEGDE